jgi:predicted metal-dependent HD superfamily phosphohydrolase
MEVLLRRIGFPQNDASIVAADIIKTYNKPERGYHGIKHISGMLKSFNRYLSESSESGLIKNPDEFRFAILMHDYVNGEADDVEKSILKAKEFLYSIAPSYDTSYVEKLILATDYSKTQSPDFEQGLMQDIDIEILGKSPDEYQKYSRDIRKQYADIPDEKFNPARTEILESFLGRKNIYNTQYYRDRYENQARSNIEQEIRMLKGAD